MRATTLFLPLFLCVLSGELCAADITTKLVLHYKLDEATGATTFADASPSNLNNPAATLMTPALTALNGKIGLAQTMDGNAINVKCVAFPVAARALTSGQAQVTMAAWIKPLTSPDTGERAIVHFETSTVGRRCSLRTVATAPNSKTFHVHYSGRKVPTDGTNVHFSANTFTNDGFTHIACIFDYANNKMTLYINGVLDSSVNTAWAAGGTSEAAVSINGWIGNTGGFGSYGIIDDVRVYQRALAAADIQALASQNARWQAAVSNKWSAAANWDNKPFSTDCTTLSFGALGTSVYQAHNDIAGVYNLNGITFDNAISGCSIIGNDIQFSGTSPFIAQNNSGAYVVTNRLFLGATTTVQGTGAGTLTLSGNIAGSGGLAKTSTNTLILSGAANNFSGPVGVQAGTLRLDGTFTGSGAISVSANAQLTGTGSAAGAVMINANGKISPAGTEAGKLSVGALTIAAGGSANFNLTTPASLTDDEIAAAGNITLDGTINVTDSGGLAAGTYRLFTYTGTRSGTPVVGTIPSGFTALINTATPNEINLVVSAVGTPPPSVSGVSPPFGPVGGALPVTVHGARFVSGATAKIGNNAITALQFVDAQTLVGILPAGTAGLTTVTVTNPDTQARTLDDAFLYLPAPTVSGVSPNFGPTAGGSSIIVSGTNFAGPPEVTSAPAVFIGGTQPANQCSNVVFMNSTTIVCTIPAGASGFTSVTVRNADNQSGTLASAFQYLGPPSAQTLIPPNGPGVGGTSIAITGSNFNPGATVTIGGVPATNVVVASSTSITCVSPAGAPGPQNVVVTNADGQSSASVPKFNYDYRSPDSLTAPFVNGLAYTFAHYATPNGGVLPPATQNTQPPPVAPTIAAFDTLTKISTGLAAGANIFDRSQRDVDATYAFKYTGFVEVPEAGIYTFYTTSDDGSAIFIGSQLVVNNNLSQSATERSGSIALLPGRHAITLLYGQGTNTQVFEVRYECVAAGIAKQTIPGSAFFVDNVALPPFFSPNGGSFTSNISVSISSPAPSASIYYTLDGSQPFQTPVQLYTGPIVLSNSATINAVAFVNGKNPSLTASAVFTRTDAPITITSVVAAGSVANGDDKRVTVAFSAPLQKVAAETITNYSITRVSDSAVMNVSASALASDNRTVAITLTSGSPMTANTKYTLTVNNLIGPAGGSVPNGTNTQFTFFATGTILREFFSNIAGDTILELTGNAAYPNLPSGGSLPTLFETATNVSDNFGTRVRGFFHPDQTGNWYFAVATDNDGELYLSTDDNPARKVQIAGMEGAAAVREWTKYPSQRSAAVALTAGRRYYVELTQKEGTGGDNIAVAAKFNNATYANGDAPVAGTMLSPYIESIVITQQPISKSAVVGSAVTFTVRVTGAAVNSLTGDSNRVYQWRKNGTNIATGTTDALTLNNVQAGDEADYSVVITNLSNSVISDVAGLKVLTTLFTGYAVTPPFGPAAGGQTVTISGLGFISNDTKVFFDNVEASVTFVDANTLRAVTPAHALGSVDVKLANNGSSTFVFPLGFTYTPAPAVISIVPPTGTPNGGTAVTVTGNGFRSGAALKIGANAATGVTVVNSTTITATTPSGPSGGADVIVTNLDGQSGTLPDGFTYAAGAAATTLAAQAKSGTYGAAITLTATLLDELNAPLAGKQIQFSVNGAPPFSATTDAGGIASASYTIAASVAGPNTVHASFTGDAGLSASSANAPLTVSAAPLTVSADNKSRYAGESNPPLTFAFSGFVNNENQSVLSGAPNISTIADSNSPAGDYTITLTAGTLTAANYTLQFSDGTLSVLNGGLVIDPESGITTTEAGGTAQFTVKLDHIPTAPVTVDLSSSATLEGAVSPAQLVFAADASALDAQTVTLTGHDDLIDDGDAAYSIDFIITSADASFANAIIPPLFATNVDNDTADVFVSTHTLTTSENGAPATFTVKLGTPPTAIVSILLLSTDTTEGTVSPPVLDFNQQNYATEQTVTVTPKPDTLADGSVVYAITLTVSTSDTVYKALNVSSVIVTNQNSNLKPVISSALGFTPAAPAVDSPVNFSVTASDPEGQALVITYDYGDGASDTTGQHVYAAAQTYTVVAHIFDGLDTVTSTVAVTVLAKNDPNADLDQDGLINSADLDDDGDGFADALEGDLGNDPYDKTNTPFGGLTAPPSIALVAPKLSISLNFAKPNSDALTLSGTLPIPQGFSINGKPVILDIGGVVARFTLDAKGAAASGGDSFKMPVKASKGVVSAQIAKFSSKLTRRSAAEKLIDEGLINADIAGAQKTVHVTILFNSKVYEVDQPQKYTAKAGKTGKSK